MRLLLPPTLYWRRLLTALWLCGLASLFIILAAPEWPAFQEERHQIETIIGQRHFDFLVWELEALAAKAEAALSGGHNHLDDATRRTFVLAYLNDLEQVREAEAEISRLYADPELSDPQAAAAELQAIVDRQRSTLARHQPLVEAIVQQQVAQVLLDEGFGLLLQAWPPVLMRMTPLPLLLVVSPRHEIRQEYALPLTHGLDIAERDDIEDFIYTEVDRAALVVPLGGLGTYPAMIVETTSIGRLAEITAHEWAHHWLSFRPLGIRYAAGPELRTMNETVASIIGDEIGRAVIERHYPELVPPPTPPTDDVHDAPEQPDRFDLNAALRETRVMVDLMLEEGRVDEAESYMEERRHYLWENGYRLRKLNQAFFAFYGAYADTPGESGDDPIGPAIVAIRANSPSLRHFAETVARITSVDSLLLAAESAGD
jgi:hypothetical protein